MPYSLSFTLQTLNAGFYQPAVCSYPLLLTCANKSKLSFSGSFLFPDYEM